MKTSRFSDSQIMAILKQAEAGTPAPELCREHGISSATFYKWRTKFGGMDASLMARLAPEKAEIADKLIHWSFQRPLTSAGRWTSCTIN